MTRLIERGYKDRKLYKVNYDFKTEQMILDMLQEGKSYDEIIKNIYVSEEYAEMIKGLAEEEGLLPQKTDWIRPWYHFLIKGYLKNADIIGNHL